MEINNKAIDYVVNNQNELIQLIKDLCKIPSFSHEEKEKAEFIKQWFNNLGMEAIIDEAYNVIVPYDIENKDEITVFAAHIDTVFPDKVGFDCVEKDGKLCAPGVGDDTANVAELMLIAKYLHENNYTCPKGCIFLFNSCEEGLGNLKGSKHFLSNYGSKVYEFHTCDLGYDEIICKAVGSIRYRINIKTEGGHSFSAFGNKNAIAIASKIIATLYEYEVPKRGKSTYNVGIIEGGTSVNTIAQNASFLFEFRSDCKADIDEMKAYFDSIIEETKNQGIDISVEIIGERPCMGDVDENHMNEIINKLLEIMTHFAGKTPKLKSGSTDLNASYALGIAGACFGGYLGKGEHTKEEYLEIDSLEVGMKILMTYILGYFK